MLAQYSSDTGLITLTILSLRYTVETTLATTSNRMYIAA